MQSTCHLKIGLVFSVLRCFNSEFKGSIVILDVITSSSRAPVSLYTILYLLKIPEKNRGEAKHGGGD